MSSRPHLLVLASTYPRWRGDHEPGFVHELARRLTREFDVMVLCPHAPGAATDEQMDGVQVHRFRYAPAALETLVNDGGIVTNLKRQRWKWLLVPAFGLALSWATWRALMRWQPDVVHAHWLLPQGAIIALARKFVRRRPPFVVTSHGADLFALRGAVLQSAKRWVARQAACITVVSAAMQDELTRLGIAPAQVQIEPMGVDLSERFAPDATVARSATEILFVGRLVEKKGLRHLLDAMPMILAQLPQARLTIAGFGPELEPRKAQARALGIEDGLDFTGPVSQADLPALYRRAAVFVAPFVQARDGDQEGLGLVSVEAIGCGCPVVVSDLPAVRQVFPNGEGARLVPPADPVALAQAVLSCMMQRDETAVAAARERMRLAFDWDSRAAAYAEILDRAMPTPRRRSAE